MNPNPIFSIPIFIDHTHVKDKKYKEMISFFEEYKSIIKTTRELEIVKKQLAKDYYSDALFWLNHFRDADWYKEDIK